MKQNSNRSFAGIHGKKGWEEQGFFFFNSGKRLLSRFASDLTTFQPSGKIMSLTEQGLSPNRIYECYWMASKTKCEL